MRRFAASLASLALIAFASLGNAQTAHAAAPSHVNTQTAEVEALLTAVHDFTSYNGDEQTAVDHLASLQELWAEDSTLVVNGTTSFAGRDAIIKFFANGSLFHNNLVGLTPSFRTKIAIHGDTAQVYLECIFLDTPDHVFTKRSLWGTARKVDGKWLFWRMANDPAQPLFP